MRSSCSIAQRLRDETSTGGQWFDCKQTGFPTDGTLTTNKHRTIFEVTNMFHCWQPEGFAQRRAKVFTLRIRLRIEAVRNVSFRSLLLFLVERNFPLASATRATLYVARALGDNVSARWRTLRGYRLQSAGRGIYAAGHPTNYGHRPNVQCCRHACETTIATATSSPGSILSDRCESGQQTCPIHVSKEPSPFCT